MIFLYPGWSEKAVWSGLPLEMWGEDFHSFLAIRGRASQAGQWPRPKEEELGAEQWVKPVWLEKEVLWGSSGRAGQRKQGGDKKVSGFRLQEPPG